jgi:type IX secretion system PorP/SprF family membrane protein
MEAIFYIKKTSFRTLIGLYLLVVPVLTVRAQQLPQNSLYSLNPFLVNPALSGAYDYTDVRVAFRRQWLGMDDAPTTAAITAHLPVSYSDKVPAGVRSPRYTRASSFRNEAPPGTWRWGAGMQVLADQAGPTARNLAVATGAGHLRLGKQWQLSAGLGAGVLQYAFRFDRIHTATGSDPILPTGTLSVVRPVLSAGLMLRRRHFHAGASVQAANAPRLQYTTASGSTLSRLAPHYYLTASYRLELSDEVALVPQVWAKATAHAPVSLDAQLRLHYTDRLWAGLQYRQGESVGAQLGLALTDLLTVNYAYEYPFSLVRLATTGSHELMLAFRFNNRAFLYNPPMGW